MKEKLIIESITYDLQYFFTNKGIVKISLDDNENTNILEYNLDNFILGLNLLKENLQTKFDMGLINENEYVFSARKYVYKTIDKITSKHNISFVNEWETKFGKNLLFINENTDRTDLRKIFNTSWEGVKTLFKNKIVDTLLNEQSTKSRSWLQWGWDNIKSTISKAFSCPKGGNYIDCFMEGLRTIATSFLGVTVLTGVSFIPAVGQIPNVVIFGALLIYDLYKMMAGKQYSVSDIVVDIVSLLAPAIAGRVGNLTKGLTSFWGLGKIAGSGALGTFIQSLSKGLGNLATIIGKTVGYFSSKLGIKWLGDMAKSANQGLTKITTDIAAGQKAANVEPKKSEKAKSAEELLKNVPQSWKKYPCVALSKNVIQKKTSDGTIVYEGGGFVWFDNGKKINPKTEEVSEYTCTPEGKVKSVETKTFEDGSLMGGLMSSLVGGLKKPSISPSQIERVQSCLGISMDGKFSKTLQEKMKSEGYGDDLNQTTYEKIMKDCGAAPVGGAQSSGGFAKDI
jgi:hypothetical protein